MDLQIKNVRNHALDFVKGIACICVVFMHCEFPGTMGMLVQCVSRFAVPFFFMVSGYFCYKSDGRVNYAKKIRHIAIITISAVLLYFIITPVYGGSGEFSLYTVANWIVFNQPVYIAGQLWFLFALLYDYIVFAIFEKLGIKKAYPFIAIVGIAAYIGLAQGAFLAGINIPNMYYRNFLVEGLPLFIAGYLIHKDQAKINLSNLLLLAVTICSTILCPVERLLFGRDFGVHIISFVQVAALFLLCVNNPGFGKGTLLNKLGARYSLYVYIIHPAAWHLLEKLYVTLHIEDNIFALYALPILCLMLTVVFSIIFVMIKTVIQNRLKIKRA